MTLATWPLRWWHFHVRPLQRRLPRKPIAKDYELHPYEMWLLRCIESRPGRARNAARSAVRHVCGAYALTSIDWEMAAFRIATAEEEAASAIILALQRIGYVGAERLSWRDHQQKAAVAVFIHALSVFFDKMSWMTAEVYFDQRFAPPRPHVRYRTRRPDGKLLSFVTKMPFHGQMTVDEALPDFKEELREVSADKNGLRAKVAERANERNLYLYGGEDGVAGVGGDPSAAIAERRVYVFSLLAFYLMIDCWDERQGFVQQALSAFIKAMPFLRLRDAV